MQACKDLKNTDFIFLSQEQTLKSILDIVMSYANDLHGRDEDHKKIIHSVHLSKLMQQIKQSEKIRFVLPAFPAKSPNLNKTSGELPDYAEVLALHHLQKLCNDIERIYAPGANIIICSDGRVFSDLVHVSDATITAYGKSIQKIISDYRLHHLSTYDMELTYAHSDFEQMRKHLIQTYGKELSTVKTEVKSHPAKQQLFNGIHRFLFEDTLFLSPNLSRNQARNFTKETAYELLQRSDAWGSLVEKVFPQAIRLSIHPQPAGSEKLGIHLAAHTDRWVTPWHSVALKQDGAFRLVKKQEALAMGAKEERYDATYAYFSL